MVQFHVGKNGNAVEGQNRRRRGAHGERRDQHLVSRPHRAGADSGKQGRRGGVEAHGIPDAELLRPLSFQGLYLLTPQEVLIVRPLELGKDRPFQDGQDRLLFLFPRRGMDGIAFRPQRFTPQQG